jgi:PAS domain S-box-containing protein
VAERTREFRNAESRFRAHVEQLPAVTYIESVRSRAPLYVSPQIESLLGITPRQWIDDPGRWAKQIHPDDCDRILVEMSLFREGGPPFRKEYRLLAHDGREVWVRHEASIVLDDARRPQFVQGVLLDITDRKRAEFAARDIEDRYRVLAIYRGALVAGQKDAILDANESAATLLRIPEGALGLLPISSRRPPAHRAYHNGSTPADPEPHFVQVAFHPRGEVPERSRFASSAVSAMLPATSASSTPLDVAPDRFAVPPASGDATQFSVRSGFSVVLEFEVRPRNDGALRDSES